MPILSGRAQIAIKQEGTAGTAETLAAADVVMVHGASTYESDIAVTAREGMTASLSPRGSVIGSKAAKIRFKMHLGCSFSHSTGAIGAPVASPSTLAMFDVPFKACGLNVTVSGAGPNEQASYKPSSTTISDETTGAYSTVGMYLDGKRYMIHGAVGNCVLTFTVGSPVTAEFEFTGVYNAPTDTALLSGAVYPTTVEPVFLGASLSVINAYTTARVSSLKLDFGNRITMRPNPNEANGTGYLSAQITGRNPTGSFDPEETLAATQNWWTLFTGGTLGAITTGTFPATSAGGVNYNQLNLTIPNAKYTKVGLADRDGVATAPVEFECVANSVAGDDEFELIQT